MKDSSHLIGDPVKLHATLQEQGYLLIRGLHDREEVLRARLKVLEHLSQLGGKLDESKPIEDGVLLSRCGKSCVPFMEGITPLTSSKEVSAILNGARPKKFFDAFFGEECMSFDFKWLRAVPNGAFTGAHTDSVYMSRGTPDLVTMWTPFGDVNQDMGTIAVLEGSNHIPEYAKRVKVHTGPLPK